MIWGLSHCLGGSILDILLASISLDTSVGALGEHLIATVAE